MEGMIDETETEKTEKAKMRLSVNQAYHDYKSLYDIQLLHIIIQEAFNWGGYVIDVS